MENGATVASPCGILHAVLSSHLALVLPARNEAARIDQVLASIPLTIPGCARITPIVVDDGSDDATAQVAARAGASVVRHVIGLGKGAALRTGCDVALVRGCDLIAVMDADGQHHPDALPAMVSPLTNAAADVTLAYRTFNPAMPLAMRLGNWGLSHAFAILFGIRYRDTQCGMRAFTAVAYRRLRWRSYDYSVETEMLIEAARHRLRVVEVPIETLYHDRYKGTTVIDGLRIFKNMLYWRLAFSA